MQTELPINVAKRFWNRGIAVVPIHYRSKVPEVRWKQYQAVPPTMQELEGWFGGSTLHNLGIVCGWSGLAVLDFDTMAEYAKWRVWSRRIGGRARIVSEQAYRVRSSRGVHVYIRLAAAEPGRSLGKVQVLGRLDVKGKGGYVLGPGSVHPSGAVYTPMQEAWIFPLCAALSDVLPTALLVTHTELPKNVTTPVVGLPVESDPWECALNAGAMGPGAVERVRALWKVEMFFTDLEHTSNDGRWYRCRCPFHDDHDPSFWLDTERQICGCFSSGCSAHDRPLDVINLYARLYGLSNTDAIGHLARKL